MYNFQMHKVKKLLKGVKMLCCAFLLQLKEQARNVKKYSPDSAELIVKGADMVYTRLYVVAA